MQTSAGSHGWCVTVCVCVEEGVHLCITLADCRHAHQFVAHRPHAFLCARSDRSDGTAKVVFAHPADASRAIQEYDGVKLDGKVMTVEIAPPRVAGGRGPMELSSGLR